MLKNPMYRRGRPGNKTGIKERIVWQLSKRSMSGRELAASISEEYEGVRKQLGDAAISKNKTVTIEATDWFVDREGKRDRVYTLIGKPRRSTPKVEAKKTIVVSLKSFAQTGEENRRKNEEAARRRRRLIKAGLYLTMEDLK